MIGQGDVHAISIRRAAGAIAVLAMLAGLAGTLPGRGAGRVVASLGGEVSDAGFTVRFPPGALTGDTDVRLTRERLADLPPLPTTAEGIAAFRVRLGKAELVAPAEVSFRSPLIPPGTSRDLVAASFDEDRGRWFLRPGWIDPRTEAFHARVPHFSPVVLAELQLPGLLDAAREVVNLVGRHTGLFGQSPPRCPAPSSFLRVAHEGGRPVDSCFEVADGDGHTIAHFVNQRAYDVVLKVEASGLPGLGAAPLLQEEWIDQDRWFGEDLVGFAWAQAVTRLSRGETIYVPRGGGTAVRLHTGDARGRDVFPVALEVVPNGFAAASRVMLLYWSKGLSGGFDILYDLAQCAAEGSIDVKGAWNRFHAQGYSPRDLADDVIRLFRTCVLELYGSELSPKLRTAIRYVATAPEVFDLFTRGLADRDARILLEDRVPRVRFDATPGPSSLIPPPILSAARALHQAAANGDADRVLQRVPPAETAVRRALEAEPRETLAVLKTLLEVPPKPSGCSGGGTTDYRFGALDPNAQDTLTLMGYRPEVALSIREALDRIPGAHACIDRYGYLRSFAAGRRAASSERENSPMADESPACRTTHWQPRPGIVPNVVGCNLQWAQDVLQRAGFVFIDDYDATGKDVVFGPTWDRNWIVVEQEPAAGTIAGRSRQIRLGARRR